MGISTNGRIPIIPLPYELKDLRDHGELIVNYDEGKIYITKKDGSKDLIDITDTVAKQIKSLDSSIVNVVIEGLGTLNVQEFLNILNNKIKNSVYLKDVTETSYLLNKAKIDNKSIETNLNKVQIYGFNKARNRTFPQKVDGHIKWVPLSGIGSSGNEDSDDVSSIDKEYGDVYEITPINGVLYPIVSKRQVTKHLTENCSVILPVAFKKYENIDWYIITDNYSPSLNFQDNIYLNSQYNLVLQPNSVYLYNFITLDGGETWMAKRTLYYNTADIPDDSEEYLTTDEVQSLWDIAMSH